MKPDYGQVPQYLGQVKQQIQEEYEMLDGMTRQQEMQQEDMQVPSSTAWACMVQERFFWQLLAEEERLAMLGGLKANWEKINKEYQSLSFTLDTPAKRKRYQYL